MYSVNLTSAMPRRGPGTPPLYGFLFNIEERLSGNLTYIWQVILLSTDCNRRTTGEMEEGLLNQYVP